MDTKAEVPRRRNCEGALASVQFTAARYEGGPVSVRYLGPVVYRTCEPGALLNGGKNMEGPGRNHPNRMTNRSSHRWQNAGEVARSTGG
jgi:hypothetical protein